MKLSKKLCDELVAKVNAIDTSRFVLKTKYYTNISDLKLPGTSRLVRKTDYDANITEIEGKMLSITDSATTSALTTVEKNTWF